MEKLFETILNEDDEIKVRKPLQQYRQHNHWGRGRPNYLRTDLPPRFKTTGELKRYPKAMLFIATHPGCRRQEVIEELNPLRRWTWTAQSYNCDLFADLADSGMIRRDTSRYQRIYPTDKCIEALRNWGLIDDDFETDWVEAEGDIVHKGDRDSLNASMKRFDAAKSIGTKESSDEENSEINFEDD